MEQLKSADRRVDKERLWVFAPVYLVVSKAEVEGDISIDQLREAIKTAVSAHELLQQKIILDEEWNAYYNPCEPFPFVIEEYDGDWREVVYAQEKIPYAIEKGEFIRFFLQKIPNGVSIMFVTHHLAGDGTSYAYLLQDILRAATGENLEYKPLHLFPMDSLPKESQLTFLMRMLMKNMNRKWNKTKRQFTFEEAKNLHQSYWENHSSVIEEEVIDGEIYDTILQNVKAHDVTVNSVITTALIRAAEELSDVGHAASIREKGYTGMGNFATGISTKYQYNENLSFWENAKNVQKLLYEKLQSPAKKYFLLQFMGQIEPTLIDAIYFAACSDYSNATAITFAKMFGYAENPKGISITNLTRLPIAEDYGKFKMTDYTFVPPLVLNSQRIIGVAAFGHRMNIALHLNKDPSVEMHRAFFHKGVEYLRQLASEGE